MALAKQPNTLLLDVRTAGEVKKGAVPNAVNIDFFDEQFAAKAKAAIGTRQGIVFCHSGGRSAEAVVMLRKEGLNVVEVPKGYAAYRE